MDLFGMMFANAGTASVALLIIFGIFGTRHILLPIANMPADIAEHLFKWLCYGLLLPGSGILYACLWFWLVLTGRRDGVNWGAALFYGIGIALVNALLCGAMAGALLGSSLVGLLFALINMLISQSFLFAILAYGVLMGLLNGLWARNWIATRKE